MARRAKPKWVPILMGLFLFLVALIVGGMFATSSTTGNVVLKYVPAPVHPMLGWVIIIIALILFVIGAYKVVKKLI